MAKLSGYRWASYYDEATERTVSDWESSEQCGRCRRSIVHIYTVQHDDGSRETVGKECAHLAMGWAYANPSALDRCRRDALVAARLEQQEAMSWNESATSGAADCADNAIRAFLARNSGPSWRPAKPQPVAVMESAGRFFAVCGDGWNGREVSAQVAALRRAGWQAAEVREVTL